MSHHMLATALLPIVGAIALFTFLAIAAWSEERRKEREAFYRSEVLKKLAERPDSEHGPILAVIREEERNRLIRSREGKKLGGMITAAVGLGSMIVLKMLVGDHGPIWTAGLIPFLIGVAILVYVIFMAPKPEPRRDS
ncbi:MAG: hypothetical protein O7A63_03085 [Acidobacteria bacterium]|nr:hypothetical protein [Acidobacteriota bacterium]